MLRSERRSLIRFLVIYLTSTFLLFSIASWVFYTSSKHHLLDTQRESLKYEAEHLQSQLRVLHQSNKTVLYYPNIKNVNSAIYDLDKKYIFGTYRSKRSLDNRDDRKLLYLVINMEPYYLGAAYLLVSKHIDFIPIEKLQRNILFFMLLGGIFFSILGYFLGKLFIEPMRNTMKQMNRFIQDTAHELNTPISTILTNIEMIETFGKHAEHPRELKRIEIASKTLSRIYDDLTYLNLNHQYHRHVVTLDMGKLVKERVVYFSAMAETKHLKTVMEIEENVLLEMDSNDALRLVDNLVSNAIKYNQTGGTLTVRVTKNRFVVQDTGIGIKKEDIHMILQRFKRANSSEGGFGIGLDIVNQVVNSYDFILNIKSKKGKGTEVNVIWKK